MPRLRQSVCAAALLFAAVGATPIAAQEKRADSLLTVEKYLDFEQVGEPRVSPDGSQIIYTRRWVNKLEDKFESAMWIMSVTSTPARTSVIIPTLPWPPSHRCAASASTATGSQ